MTLWNRITAAISKDRASGQKRTPPIRRKPKPADTSFRQVMQGQYLRNGAAVKEGLGAVALILDGKATSNGAPIERWGDRISTAIQYYQGGSATKEGINAFVDSVERVQKANIRSSDSREQKWYDLENLRLELQYKNWQTEQQRKSRNPLEDITVILSGNKQRADGSYIWKIPDRIAEARCVVQQYDGTAAKAEIDAGINGALQRQKRVVSEEYWNAMQGLRKQLYAQNTAHAKQTAYHPTPAKVVPFAPHVAMGNKRQMSGWKKAALGTAAGVCLVVGMARAATNPTTSPPYTANTVQEQVWSMPQQPLRPIPATEVLVQEDAFPTQVPINDPTAAVQTVRYEQRAQQERESRKHRTAAAETLAFQYVTPKGQLLVQNSLSSTEKSELEQRIHVTAFRHCGQAAREFMDNVYPGTNVSEMLGYPQRGAHARNLYKKLTKSGWQEVKTDRKLQDTLQLYDTILWSNAEEANRHVSVVVGTNLVGEPLLADRWGYDNRVLTLDEAKEEMKENAYWINHVLRAPAERLEQVIATVHGSGAQQVAEAAPAVLHLADGSTVPIVTYAAQRYNAESAGVNAPPANVQNASQYLPAAARPTIPVPFQSAATDSSATEKTGAPTLSRKFSYAPEQRVMLIARREH